LSKDGRDFGTRIRTKTRIEDDIENAEAIEAWRETLPERRRKRLVHPLSNVRAWRQSTTQSNQISRHGGRPEYPGDLQRDALMHWRRFRQCLEALPDDQAEHVWHTVSVEIAALRCAKQ